MIANMQQEGGSTAVLIGRWEQASRKMAELAEVIPPDRLDSQPLAGIRSFGDVLRHVAFWNQYVADTLNGKQAADDGNELPQAKYSAKASILEALKSSSEDVAKALRENRTALDCKTTELIMTFVAHTSEHYGQLVVYTRLLGIAPPASRA
jgi:uncharacterized damage-inducible protein DinB